MPFTAAARSLMDWSLVVSAAVVEGTLTTVFLYNPSLHADSALAWAGVALSVAAVRPIAGWTLEVSAAVTHGLRSSAW